jgi:hypothetical protein
MDSLITAAGRALAAGDPFGALNRIALREDAPALALRGIAMAQLGDLDRAKALLKRAARGFGPKEAVARSRCVVAEAEIALVSRDLGWPPKALDAARNLQERGDRGECRLGPLVGVRRLLLIVRLDEAERALADLDPAPCRRPQSPPRTGGRRKCDTPPSNPVARAALGPGRESREPCRHPALTAEVENAAPCSTAGGAPDRERHARLLGLDESEALQARVARRRSLPSRTCATPPRGSARQPAVLFGLAARWAKQGRRRVRTLCQRAFRAKEPTKSHRARLRVEIGRFRAALRGLAGVNATRRGLHCAAPRPRGRRWHRPSTTSMRRCRPVSPKGSLVRIRPGAGPRRQPAYRHEPSTPLARPARYSRSPRAARRWMTRGPGFPTTFYSRPLAGR